MKPTVYGKISAFFGVAAAALAAACAPPRPRNSALREAATVEDFAPTPVRVKLPRRSAKAVTGSAFIARVQGLSPGAREEAIFAEFMAGNIPNFLRTLVPVHLEAKDTWNRRITATVWVMPDYAAIGSDADFVRIPMNGETALRIARTLGMALPTDRVVDAVHAQADVRVKPRFLPAGPWMTSCDAYAQHQRLIQADLAALRLWNEPGRIVSGQKKDLIFNRALVRHQDRLVIYGWHRLTGEPTQPVSDAHALRYADYSHGVRFIGRNVIVDGTPMSLEAALADKNLATPFSADGRIENVGALFGQSY